MCEIVVYAELNASKSVFSNLLNQLILCKIERQNIQKEVIRPLLDENWLGQIGL